MDGEFDFQLKIHRDGKSPIWSYYRYETLSKAREHALDCVSHHPKVEIYAIGRGLEYGKEFVVETHFREQFKREIAFGVDPDKWRLTPNSMEET